MVSLLHRATINKGQENEQSLVFSNVVWTSFMQTVTGHFVRARRTEHSMSTYFTVMLRYINIQILGLNAPSALS